MYDIITVGSATIDVFAHTEFSEIIKIREPKKENDFLAYPLGSKILINELRFTTGGGGTNTAVSFSRLGHKTAWFGKLGNDINSKMIIEELNKEGVDVLAVNGDGHSGYSVILDSIADDRTILAYKGVNDELRFSEVPLKKLKTKWFYFSSMMGESFKTLERLSEYAEKNKIKIAFNPSTYLAKKGIDYLKKILSRTSILVLNKEEACLLTNELEMNKVLIKIHSNGPKIVVITNGKESAVASDREYLYTIKPRKIKVVETTGAGDAFASGFLSGIIRKNIVTHKSFLVKNFEASYIHSPRNLRKTFLAQYNIEFALKLATANAESVISYHGAKNKLLRYKEALGAIKRCSYKITKKRFYEKRQRNLSTTY